MAPYGTLIIYCYVTTILDRDYTCPTRRLIVAKLQYKTQEGAEFIIKTHRSRLEPENQQNYTYVWQADSVDMTPTPSMK